MTTHRSFCRICIGVCGIQVEVEDGRAVAVRGDAAHPISKGYTCAKGRALPHLHADDRRLVAPLVRGSDGELVATSWDRALGELGSALADVALTHGTDAIGFFLGNGMYLDASGYWAAKRLQRVLRSTHIYSNASIDSAGKYRVGELMAGTYALTPQVDPGARLVLMFGTNPVVSHGQLPMFENPVERLRASSATGDVWVIDPRTTESARLADHHLAIRPGTDHSLLAFLVRELLERCDLERLRVRAVHVDELRAAVAPYTLAPVATATGLAPADVVALARAVEQAGRVAVLSGTGITMSPAANTTEWLILALLLVTDSLDRPGGMWCNPGYLARLDQRDALPAVPPSAAGPPTRPDIARLMGEWPAAVIPAEIEAGNLKALIVMGGNLVTCLPDTARAVAALRDLDVLAVIEVAPTETAALATHVLASHAQLERPDVSMLNDLFNPIVATQYTDAVLPPADGRRSAWWILSQIGRALGVDVLPEGLDLDTATDHDVLDRAAGASATALRHAVDPWGVAPMPDHGWVDQRLPIGRWDLAPAPLVAQLATMVAPPPLVLTPRRQPKRMNGQTLRGGDVAEVLVHPSDAEAAGIRHGELVDVVSDVGSVRLSASVTESTRPGAVSMAHGWSEANVNTLIDSRALDPLTGMPLLSGTPVAIRPVVDAVAAGGGEP